MEILKTDGFENIYEVGRFKKEWSKTTSDNPRYQDWLFTNLQALDDFGLSALKLDGFEVLSTSPNLYSMKYPHSKLNPRIIFAFLNGNTILLLKPFKESSKSSNSDYKMAINTARKRLQFSKEYCCL